MIIVRLFSPHWEELSYFPSAPGTLGQFVSKENNWNAVREKFNNSKKTLARTSWEAYVTMDRTVKL